ncbi:MAG: hypothetical protein EP343_03150 [Deltaproteobacteria bacterium]|nr:MAG: hypothetical protein EP343_03150 [Deltaproteobacteria bacterium]
MRQWERVDDTLDLWRMDYPLVQNSDDPARVATSCVLRFREQELMLISPPKCDDIDQLYDALGELGVVTAIVPPCGFHRAGISDAQKRYPEAKLYSDERARKRVCAVSPNPEQWRPLSELQDQLPSHIECFVPPHLKRPDLIVWIHTSQGTVWYVNDLITNFPSMPRNPFLRFFLWMLRFKAGLAVNVLGGKVVLVKDQAAFSAWLQEQLAKHPPYLWVPGHGPVVRDPDLLATLPKLVAEGY